MRVESHPQKFHLFIFLALASIFTFGHVGWAQVPAISSISPSGAVQFQSSNTLSFSAASSVGINAGGISVQLTSTSLAGQSSVTTLTAGSGLTVGGTSTSRTVTASLNSNLVYMAIIGVTNVNGQSATSTVTFDTVNPVYTFEAEDFDYTNRQYFDNPQTNKYSGRGVTYEVDAHNGNFGNGGNAYRPSGLNTENAGDIARPAYAAGLHDYDVGWNDGGSGKWGNYTRTFPVGTYNIYMRAANFNDSKTDSAGAALVTGGWGTSSQTTSNIGTFSVPNTGDWQVYTWVPLRDLNGNLAQFAGGAVKTLRVTTDNGNYNANFYLLMPADLCCRSSPICIQTARPFLNLPIN